MHFVRLFLGSLLFTLLLALAGYLFSMPVFPAEATTSWITPTVTPRCATPTVTPTYTATPTPFGQAQALITMTPSRTPGPTTTPCVPTITPPPTTSCATPTPTMTPSPLTDEMVLLTPTPSATPCAGTITPTYTPTPTPHGSVFSATLHLEPSTTTLTVGEPLVVAFNLDVEGCVYASYDLTLEQVGGTLFEHINPADPTIGPPVSYPAVFELEAIQSGTIQLRGKLFGEVNCQGWQWQYIYSELITITVLPEVEPTPLPTHLINVTVNITTTTVEVGDELIIDMAYSNESGCEVVMWAANLLQSDPALFEYVEPTTSFIAPVESWPASFRIRAITAGTVQLSGRVDGEIHCADGGYYSIFVSSEAPLNITIEENSGGGGVTPTTYQQFLPVLQRVN